MDRSVNDLYNVYTLLFLQKATKKTDRPRLKEVEVTDLTDDDLKQQLEKHGVQPGPVVGEFLEACVKSKVMVANIEDLPAFTKNPSNVVSM